MKVYTIDKNGELAFEVPFKSFVKGINHRGYNTIAPENTLPAYILSAKKGFRYVETDISFTAADTDNPNGVPVLLHDQTINRCSNGTGYLKDMTFAQVRQYDFGSWKSAEYAGTKIPALAEFLPLCRNLGLHPYLEIKDTEQYTQAQLQLIVDMVRSCGMRGNVSYISFNTSFLATIKTLDEYSRLGIVCNNVTSTEIITAQSLMTGTNDVFIDSGAASDAQYQLCKDANIPLERWTMNVKAGIVNLDDYISGVTSDSLNAEYIRYEKSLIS